MRFSEHWLREWVDPRLDSAALGERLTMAGLELDSLEIAAPPFARVVVAKVVSVDPHPGADRLRVCRVDEGGAEPVQVVCGAPNVRVGMKAPLARVGAELPGGLRIGRARLRGVESFGMLCSAKELGLAESAEGLMELPPDAPVGEDLRIYMDLDDLVFEIDLTPNRADCLSIAGLAREVSALTGAAVHPVAPRPVTPGLSDTFPVEIVDPHACPRYVGRVIRSIDPQARTPLWMEERLRRGGIRAIHPVVDVTNYVMLELGQPMHGFDLQRLKGGIVVRPARAGERLELLDGAQVELREATLVIADGSGPVALAGVMGGAGSAVGEATRDVFLESAFFAPPAIAGEARAYGLHTDSAHRFERGVDPELQVRAMERATALLLEIAGGVPGPLVERVSKAHLPRRQAIGLREARICRVLGIAVPPGEVVRILGALGCVVEDCGDEVGWHVTPPSFRFDLEREVDLIEEVGRVHGYDQIPEDTHVYAPGIRPRPEARIPRHRFAELLVGRGWFEVVTFSFVEERLESFFAAQPPLRLANPISSELAVMRSTLWSGMLPVLLRNLNRQQRDLRLFETGLRFLNTEAGVEQRPALAGVATGRAWPEQWGAEPRALDFFDLKGEVEALLSLTERSFRFEAAEVPGLHPGQSARVLYGDREVGKLGALHPEVQRALDLTQAVFVFELDLEPITRGRVPRFEPLSRYPAIRRDLAVLVDRDVPAARLLEAVRAAGGSALREAIVFDVYTGQGVPEGRKSVALGLILQEMSRTLTDQEVDGLVGRVVDRLRRDMGAILRE